MVDRFPPPELLAIDPPLSAPKARMGLPAYGPRVYLTHEEDLILAIGSPQSAR